MAERSQQAEVPKYRMSGPVKKGLRSLGYGLGVLFGFLTGGFSTVVGALVLGAAALYSGAKSASDLYKSTQEKYKEKTGSYIGRGLTYLGRTVGTVTVPWLQGFLSMISGGSRIYQNEYRGYDFMDIPPYEEQLKGKERVAAPKQKPTKK